MSEIQKWQPIDTAPKDGTAVLLAVLIYGRYDLVTGYYQGSYGPYSQWALVQTGDYASNSDVDGIPQYWMQLPEPPKDD